MKELRSALKLVGFDLPGCEVRDLEDELKRSDANRDGKLSLHEFQSVSIFKGQKMFAVKRNEWWKEGEGGNFRRQKYPKTVAKKRKKLIFLSTVKELLRNKRSVF